VHPLRGEKRDLIEEALGFVVEVGDQPFQLRD
jgi:hypothetical protein